MAPIRALHPLRWPKIQIGIQQALADLNQHGCCTSFGEWRPEVHGIGIPLMLGSALPDIVVRADRGLTPTAAGAHSQEANNIILGALAI